MIKNWKKLGLAVSAASALLLTACGEQASSEDTLVDGEEIHFAYVAWDDLIASTNVVATVLEDLGYETKMSNMDNAIMWEAVSTGDADVTLGASLPETHAPQYERYGDSMVHVNSHIEGSTNAFVVPEYMDVDSIAELSDEASQEIIGIEPGGGLMMVANQAMEDYDNLVDWDLISSSSGAMVTELRTAIENQEEIVVTGWIPHWKFLEFDLKILDDPEGSLGGEQSINTFVREGFQEDYPVAYSVLENFEWGIDDVENVMLAVSRGQSPEDAAREWVDENPEMVQDWTKDVQEVAAEHLETVE